jgi:hypothetical protein
MSKPTTPAKSTFPFAFLFGVIMMLELILSYILAVNATQKWYGISINLLNYLILPFVFCLINARQFRNQINNGYISLGQTIKIGVSLCVLAGLIASIFSVIFNYLVPEFMEEMYRSMSKVMHEQKPPLTEEQIEMGISMTKKFQHPLILIPLGMVMYSFIGLVHGAIVGLIVRTEKK